tara:strand:- start:7064 stop:9511 length:2448 start_codon:yes stop_codon:yes gene_type:complete
MANSNVPQIDDPYVGKVYGNILDNYHSPTYNAKLYMLRSELSVNAKDGVASFDESLTGPPGDQIVLAQTGVTAATIDNIAIQALTATDGPNAIQVSFTVHQPGAATFLDQMQLARAFLGQENSYMPIVFLEIRFQGYEADIETDTDDIEGGGFTQIKGPYRWKLNITGIQVEITEGGSQYEITAVPTKSFAYTSPFFRIPANFTTVGKTITEHTKSLEEQLNKYHREVATHEVKDTFEFDLSELLGSTGELKIVDENLITSADADTDNRNEQMNETFKIGDAVTAKKAFVDAPKDSGTEPEQVFDEDKLNVPKDITIEKYFATLLSMNQEFYTKISRKEELDRPESDAKLDQAYVVWFKMDANTTMLGYDKSRNGHAHHVIYKPRMYRSSRPDIVIDDKEIQSKPDDFKSRAEEIFAQGGLKKAYHYIFTGLNDQIMSLDIKYDNGIALMVPPAGGALGQAAVVLAEKSGTIPAGEDTTLEGVVENFIEAKGNSTAKEVFNNLIDGINKLKDAASNGLSGLVQQLEDATGLDVDIIKSAIEDGDNADARQALELALDSEALSAINAQNNINNPTTEFPEYKPELSGYNYAVDLVNPMETPMTADDLEQLGYLTLETVEEATEIKPKLDSTKLQSDADNQTATIKKGSVQNTLFGVIASQHSNDIGFLLQLDMTLRGDPWYLGKDTNDNSDEEQANFFKDDNHFYLGLRSPKTFDMDWRDEDSDINTGYWKGDGVSRSFGGVYRLISVTNNFSNGEFTVDVNAQRVVPTQDPKVGALVGAKGAAGTSGTLNVDTDDKLNESTENKDNFRGRKWPFG